MIAAPVAVGALMFVAGLGSTGTGLVFAARFGSSGNLPSKATRLVVGGIITLCGLLAAIVGLMLAGSTV